MTYKSISTVMFDFYGTLVDMQSGLTEVMRPYLAQQGYTANPPGRVVTWWRRTHFENSMIDALLHREHTPYREIGRQAVHATLERSGIEHTDDDLRWLVAQIERLPPFPDVVAALERLRASGLRLVILSNGDPDMLARGVAFAGVEHLFAHVISVAEAGSFKPHVATYRTAAEIVGIRPDEVMFVANHEFDCVGAKGFGMHAAFIDRRRRPFGNTTYPPDLIVGDFSELADVLTA